MLEGIENKLPLWFTSRLMQEEFYYGLLTTSGAIIPIDRIRGFSQMPDGSIWMDVDLVRGAVLDNLLNMPYLSVAQLSSADSSATINVNQIIAAFDLGHYSEN